VGKNLQVTGHADGQQRGPKRSWVVKRHAPAALPPGKSHGTHSRAGWVGLQGRSGLVWRKEQSIASTGVGTPNRSA